MDQQPRRFVGQPVVLALWANAALLVVVILVLLSRSSLPSVLPAAYAQAQGPIAGGAGVFVVPGQFSVNTWGIYLLDIDAQTLAAYQFQPGEKQLKLIAARNYRYDRRLGHFNTTPDPDDVKALIAKEQDSARVLEPNKQLPPAEAPPKNE
jgi:hypothetical protein